MAWFSRNRAIRCSRSTLPSGRALHGEGFGKVIGIDEHLVVPNRSLSIYDGAVVCWRGEKMGEWKDMVIRGAEKAGLPIFTPYC